MRRPALACLTIISAWLLLTTCSMAASIDVPTGSHALATGFDALTQAIAQSRDAPRNAAAREQVGLAARRFQAQLALDGNARPELANDTKNIIASLADGSYSADGSLRALQRDVKGSVIQFGHGSPWHPPGNAITTAFGNHLDQRHEGDCVGISVVKAFAQTQTGMAILRHAVTQDGQGGYNVSLPGAPDRVFHLQANELDQYGVNDPPAAALVGAFFQYFHLDPAKNSLPTNKVMELLAGTYGDHRRLADENAPPQHIAQFLADHADALNHHREAMVFGGKPGRQGEWSRGDGHAFAVIAIDPEHGVLTYTNPWNEEVNRTIRIADLASQATGTSADFEVVDFPRTDER